MQAGELKYSSPEELRKMGNLMYRWAEPPTINTERWNSRPQQVFTPTSHLTYSSSYLLLLHFYTLLASFRSTGP